MKKSATHIVVAAVALLAVLVVLINPETIGLDVARDGKLTRVLALFWVLAAMVSVVLCQLIRADHRRMVAFTEPITSVSDRLSLICTRLC